MRVDVGEEGKVGARDRVCGGCEREYRRSTPRRLPSESLAGGGRAWDRGVQNDQARRDVVEELAALINARRLVDFDFDQMQARPQQKAPLVVR